MKAVKKESHDLKAMHGANASGLEVWISEKKSYDMGPLLHIKQSIRGGALLDSFHDHAQMPHVEPPIPIIVPLDFDEVKRKLVSGDVDVSETFKRMRKNIEEIADEYAEVGN